MDNKYFIIIGILIILVISRILMYTLSLLTKLRYLKLIESLQTLENLPDDVYRKTGNFSLEKFQKEDSMKTFVFCFNYVFIEVVRRYLKFSGLFIQIDSRVHICKIGLRSTKFESILNSFLENTSKEIKTGADLYVFLKTIETCEFKEIINSFINKDLIYKLENMNLN
jgi:hypothetical protein